MLPVNLYSFQTFVSNGKLNINLFLPNILKEAVNACMDDCSLIQIDTILSIQSLQAAMIVTTFPIDSTRPSELRVSSTVRMLSID